MLQKLLLLIFILSSFQSWVQTQDDTYLSKDELLFIVSSDNAIGRQFVSTSDNDISFVAGFLPLLPDAKIVAVSRGDDTGDVLWMVKPCTKNQHCDLLSEYTSILAEQGWYQPWFRSGIFSITDKELERYPFDKGMLLCDPVQGNGIKVYDNPAPFGYVALRIHTARLDETQSCRDINNKSDSTYRQSWQPISEILPKLVPINGVVFSNELGIVGYNPIMISAFDYAEVISTSDTMVFANDLVKDFEAKLINEGWQRVTTKEETTSLYTEWEYLDSIGAIWRATLNINKISDDSVHSVQWFVTLLDQ